MALSSGTKLGPYEIQSPLGAGGMGEVYRARDTKLNRGFRRRVYVTSRIEPLELSSHQFASAANSFSVSWRTIRQLPADSEVVGTLAILRWLWSPDEAERMICSVSWSELEPKEGSMEHVIGGLLQDFEAGKLTRRQLIQALTLGVTAGPAALAAAQKLAEKSSIPPPHSPAPWKTVWLDHVSYAVSDYRRSTAFYRDLMGWEIIHDDGQKQCSMKVGNVGGIIIRNRAGYAGAAEGPTQPTITGVIDHISWGIEPWDTAKVKAELEKRGLDLRPDMNGKFQSFHVHDPDGWDLQISNQTDTSQL
jgi:catechol 2,3-dioxygenase-like lactoylglutathione lyase family enzyme